MSEPFKKVLRRVKDFFLKYWLWFAIPIGLYWVVRGAILFTTDLKKCILWFGIPMSVYWGLRGVILFPPKTAKFRDVFCTGVSSFISNFVGSLAGWSCLYVFIKYASFKNLRLADFVLLILSIMGLTGLLPQFILGIVVLPEKVANSIRKKLGIE
jgi:hypothetical protein